MATPEEIKQQQAYDRFTDEIACGVAWAAGINHAWECDALIGAKQLELLVMLAFHAPKHARDAFLAEWNED